MKVLVIADFWSYRINAKGMGAVYQVCDDIGKKKIEIHVISAARITDETQKKLFVWSKKEGELLIHFFNLYWLPIDGLINLAFSRLMYFIYSMILHLKYRYDIIHDYTSTPFSFLTAVFYKLLGVKTVYSVCTKSKINFFDRIYFWKLFKFTDKVIITSKYYFEVINKILFSANKIKYISLGADKDHYQPVLRGGKRTKIFYIGTYEEKKGTDLFFKAAKLLPDLNFVWITQKAEFKPARIEIIEGIVNLSDYLSFGDICLLPFRNLDGVLFEPQTLLDAMSLGCAVITTDFPQLKSIAGESACYFPPGEINSMIRQVDKIASSKRERQKMAQKARLIVEKQYNRRKKVEEIVNLYKEILNDKK